MEFFDESVSNPVLLRETQSSLAQLNNEDFTLILQNVHRLLKK